MARDIRNREDVEQLVHTFYDRIQQHPRLGYIFNQVATINWDLHLPKMVNFWENILFGTGKYKGNPLAVHQKVHQQHPLNETLFEEWLMLFTKTVDDLFSGASATRAKERAAAIAQMMLQRLQEHSPFSYSE